MEKADLQELQAAIDSNLRRAEASRFAERLWQRDLTLWSGYDQAALQSIATRLGWLDAPEHFANQVEDLSRFALQIVNDGFTHVAVLGMGGSSLCVEVLRDVFGSRDGYPVLHVLDSTHPDQIRSLEHSLDLARTLFVVSSKSGSTLEPNCFFDYFWERAREVRGEQPGSQFVAVTDPDSELAALGIERQFRRVFLNPADIGGRFSVLSYFGLLPAALMGIDLRELLKRAVGSIKSSKLGVAENTPLRFGAALAAAASIGRDKLTIQTSRSLQSFGYWAEQLIAESTGKQGTGILPVEGEGVLQDDWYGDDRFFVRLAIPAEKVTFEQEPAFAMELSDRYDIGAQFFTWEFATAVAGWLLNINPFDEPNVAESKANTNRVLSGGASSQVACTHVAFKNNADSLAGDIDRFLGNAIEPNEYLAIMAYIERTPNAIAALDHLRRKLEEKFRIATTVGFGPRFLHSTGQYHKGGPNEGVYIQITDIPNHDLSIPGKAFTFGQLIAAQAEGDRESLTSKGKTLLLLTMGATPAQNLNDIAGFL